MNHLLIVWVLIFNLDALINKTILIIIILINLKILKDGGAKPFGRDSCVQARAGLAFE